MRGRRRPGVDAGSSRRRRGRWVPELPAGGEAFAGGESAVRARLAALWRVEARVDHGPRSRRRARAPRRARHGPLACMKPAARAREFGARSTRLASGPGTRVSQPPVRCTASCSGASSTTVPARTHQLGPHGRQPACRRCRGTTTSRSSPRGATGARLPVHRRDPDPAAARGLAPPPRGHATCFLTRGDLWQSWEKARRTSSATWSTRTGRSTRSTGCSRARLSSVLPLLLARRLRQEADRRRYPQHGRFAPQDAR